MGGHGCLASSRNKGMKGRELAGRSISRNSLESILQRQESNWKWTGGLGGKQKEGERRDNIKSQ